MLRAVMFAGRCYWNIQATLHSNAAAAAAAAAAKATAEREEAKLTNHVQMHEHVVVQLQETI
jgi:hypothetical protein